MTKTADKWEYALEDLWKELDHFEMLDTFGPTPSSKEEWLEVCPDVKEFAIVMHNKRGQHSRWKNMQRALEWLHEVTDQKRYAPDGQPYTWDGFCEYYGKRADKMWTAAQIQTHEEEEEEKTEEKKEEQEEESQETRFDACGTIRTYSGFEEQHGGDNAAVEWAKAKEREVRKDADGIYYTQKEFEDEYAAEAAKRWQDARHRGREERRKDDDDKYYTFGQYTVEYKDEGRTRWELASKRAITDSTN